MEIYTKSAKDTKSFGQKFGSTLIGGEVVALAGDLGSGKTTFVQGLAKGLGIKDQIVSPTFVLIRQYPVNFKFQILNFKFLYHIDLYRLETGVEQEIKNLGLEDLWGKTENIVVIEWADKIKELLPKNTIWFTFEGRGEEERKIVISK